MSAKKTALYDEHVSLGGRMVEFAGWCMPIQYEGIVAEHRACRNAAGLFDVSHMGELRVRGEGAREFLNSVITNDLSNTPAGGAIYSPICNERGGTVDDLIIYCLNDRDYLVVVNAANTAKDFEHFLSLAKTKDPTGKEISVEDTSGEYSQIAIQGPRAVEILNKCVHEPVDDIGRFTFREIKVGGVPVIAARTGYTGEDGFELYTPWDAGPAIWSRLMKEGHAFGLKPVGLGARDSLRLEMKYPLYGQELTDTISPLEAGLGWAVKLKKESFLGKQALISQKEKGVLRTIVAVELSGKGMLRPGYRVFDSDGKQDHGYLTSGGYSPSKEKAIGLALVSSGSISIGDQLMIKVRENLIPAVAVKAPFI